MKIILIINVFIVMLYSSITAETVSITKFLGTAKNDYAVTAQQEKYTFLKENFPGIPLVNDIELKLTEKSFDPNQINYSLRIQPRGFGETKAARNFNRTLLNKSKQKDLLLQNKALKERYVLVIDFMEFQTLHSLYNELTVLYDDKIKVMEKLHAANAEFDINDLIEAEDDNTKLRAQNMDNQKMIEIYAQKISEYLGEKNFSDFDTNGLITTELLISSIENNVFQIDTDNVYLQNLRLGLDLEQKKYQLERAESRQYISYFGVGYDNGEMLDQLDKRNREKDYNLNSAYSFECGIKLPFLTNAKHDVIRRKIALVSAKEEYDQLKRELTDQINKDLKDLKLFIEQYRYLKAREQEVDAKSSLKKYLQLSGVNPIILLSIKESILKNQIARSKTEFSIYRNYIQVIDITGELSKWPLKNFLLR
jgi:hypothetical protein